MVNELTGVKVTYGYDEFSNLVWSNQGGQLDFLHRSVDDVGNLIFKSFSRRKAASPLWVLFVVAYKINRATSSRVIYKFAFLTFVHQ
ncbi:hypothetical protein B1B04_18675 [Lysinibacillus sp. KCTC 33748]|uniref:hypothetical protein n=1 Tax=unclassified Lysinibacillus TaxID=2636778 RepID=UPI0009A878F8|nr:MULTISPECIES: hypothetical protein [unclassified Lysinibacillus]OXS70193.1 hypothetical protein B1B04_18675 [Lysinibacillus sp. KCTC 33748]